MLTARADDRVLGYLGRALSLELSAVQMYSTQARLVASWGLADAAARLRNESEEELQHVNRIIERMLATGVAPSASQLRPVRLARDLSSLLQINQQFESELIELYRNAVNHCARVGDHDHRTFFEALHEDERSHHQELLGWQASLQPATAAANGRRSYR
ncbi:ferritin-like domain-containing protein [Thiosocius teredinicola]|uniref:ferritin-like domain-containing protein n=1 Tax=Thiosocius teredinicola TaxID=1973002 RepID=UPI0009912B3D